MGLSLDRNPNEYDDINSFKHIVINNNMTVTPDYWKILLVFLWISEGKELIEYVILDGCLVVIKIPY